MEKVSTAIDFGGGKEVRFERIGVAGVITLTRPEKLNALSHAMIKAIDRALRDWEADDAVLVVIIKAEGRAFCAGGDLRQIYESRETPLVDYFADEYRLNAYIESYRKPYVALIDGLVMGGGVGVAFHGSHRVMTENAVFGMPECGIGFFPDVGATHLLSDLADNFGMYLGLTATRIRQGDALWSGLATHAIKSDDLEPLYHMLVETGEMDGATRYFLTLARRETNRETIAKIDSWFGAATLPETLDRIELAAMTDEFAAEILAMLRKMSPTSLFVAFRSLSAGQTLSMAECMKMEYRICNRMLHGQDLYEGARTAIIDRGDKPRWRPQRIEDVEEADIDSYFAEPAGGDLVL